MWTLRDKKRSARGMPSSCARSTVERYRCIPLHKKCVNKSSPAPSEWHRAGVIKFACIYILVLESATADSGTGQLPRNGYTGERAGKEAGRQRHVRTECRPLVGCNVRGQCRAELAN